jgi:hypothetical protein
MEVVDRSPRCNELMVLISLRLNHPTVSSGRERRRKSYWTITKNVVCDRLASIVASSKTAIRGIRGAGRRTSLYPAPTACGTPVAFQIADNVAFSRAIARRLVAVVMAGGMAAARRGGPGA